MAPEEKAKELFDRFYDDVNFSECYQGSKESSSQCALICVDEIISLLGTMQQGNLILSYWLDVKQELLTL